MPPFVEHPGAVPQPRRHPARPGPHPLPPVGRRPRLGGDRGAAHRARPGVVGEHPRPLVGRAPRRGRPRPRPEGIGPPARTWPSSSTGARSCASAPTGRATRSTGSGSASRCRAGSTSSFQGGVEHPDGTKDAVRRDRARVRGRPRDPAVPPGPDHVPHGRRLHPARSPSRSSTTPACRSGRASTSASTASTTARTAARSRSRASTSPTSPTPTPPGGSTSSSTTSCGSRTRSAAASASATSRPSSSAPSPSSVSTSSSSFL